MGPYAALTLLEALKERKNALSLDISCNYFLILDRPDLFTNPAVRVHAISHDVHEMLSCSGLMQGPGNALGKVHPEEDRSVSSLEIRIQSARTALSGKVDEEKKKVDELKKALNGDDAKKKAASEGIVKGAETKLNDAEAKLLSFQKVIQDYCKVWEIEVDRLKKDKGEGKMKPGFARLSGQHINTSLQHAEEMFNMFQEQLKFAGANEAPKTTDAAKPKEPDFSSMRKSLTQFYVNRIQKALEKWVSVSVCHFS
jgi:exonuclease VII large subunit